MVKLIKLPETAAQKTARALTERRERAHGVPLGTYSGYTWLRPVVPPKSTHNARPISANAL